MEYTHHHHFLVSGFESLVSLNLTCLVFIVGAVTVYPLKGRELSK